MTLREELSTCYPDIFPDMQVPVYSQRLFIRLWHRFPGMHLTELSRQSKLSRPTCYKLVERLQARGDIRGEKCDGTRLSESDIKISVDSVSLGDLSHFRRPDLFRRIGVHEDFVRAAIQLLARYDRDFIGKLEDDEVDLHELLSLIHRKLKTPAAAAGRNAPNPNVNPAYRHLT